MLFLQEVILALSLHLEFGPSVNTIFFSDKLIQDYYMRPNTVSYGGDIFLKSDVNNLFGFAKYRQYSFNIDDSI